MLRPVAGRITAVFSEPRPLGAEKPDHVHGAIDIGADIGTPFRAPEAGIVYRYRAARSQEGENCPDIIPGPRGKPFAFRNYFQDIYGTITILEGASGSVHVFAHSYFKQAILCSGGLGSWEYIEMAKDSRFPIGFYHTFRHPYRVGAGEIIGRVGNAGFSTGAHLHWEIHRKLDEWTSYAERENPEALLDK